MQRLEEMMRQKKSEIQFEQLYALIFALNPKTLQELNTDWQKLEAVLNDKLLANEDLAEDGVDLDTLLAITKVEGKLSSGFS